MILCSFDPVIDDNITTLSQNIAGETCKPYPRVSSPEIIDTI